MEFFNQLLRENPGKMKNALDSLEAFQKDSQEVIEEVKQKMGQSLLFSRLMVLLEPEQRQVLALLSGYREIGDKAGEDTTLNNISQVFKTRGDYDTALKYLEQSLKIRQEIGDKSGSIATLRNMAFIALDKQDIEKFIEYETTAYKIALETKNAKTFY